MTASGFISEALEILFFNLDVTFESYSGHAIYENRVLVYYRALSFYKFFLESLAKTIELVLMRMNAHFVTNKPGTNLIPAFLFL